MCSLCNYSKLFRERHLSNTPKRLSVIEIIGNSTSPMSAQDVYETMNRTQSVNRTTIYRILDLLVEKELIERLSSGDRSFRYGLAPNTHHPPHPHFFCKECNRLECLNPKSLNLEMEALKRTFPGKIDKTEIRFEGICMHCLNNERKKKNEI